MIKLMWKLGDGTIYTVEPLDADYLLEPLWEDYQQTKTTGKFTISVCDEGCGKYLMRNGSSEYVPGFIDRSCFGEDFQFTFEEGKIFAEKHYNMRGLL